MPRVGVGLAGLVVAFAVVAGCGTSAPPAGSPSASTAAPTSTSTPSPTVPASPTAIVTPAPSTPGAAPSSWQVVDTPAGLGPGHLRDLTTFRGSLVAVGASDASLGRIWSSPDGEAWTSISGSIALDGMRLNSIAVGEQGIVVVGWMDSGAVALFSPDGISWSRRPLPGSHPGSSAMSVAWRDGRYVAVGGGGEPNAAVSWQSDDGRSWTRVAIVTEGDQESLSSVVAGPAGFVAAGTRGGHGTTWTSADGQAWTRTDLPDSTGADPGRIRFIDSTLFLPDAESMLWTSSDGRHWARTTVPGFGVGVFDVAAIPGGLIAVGRSSDGSESGVVATAGSDSMVWTTQPIEPARGGALEAAILMAPDGRKLIGVGMNISGDTVFSLANPGSLLTNPSGLSLAAFDIHTRTSTDGSTVVQIRIRVEVTSSVVVRLAQGGKTAWPRFSMKQVGNHALFDALTPTGPALLAAGSTTAYDLTFDAPQSYGGTAQPATLGTWVLDMQLEDETGRAMELTIPVTISGTT